VKITHWINYGDIRKKMPVILFVLSLMFWSFAYGVAVQKFRLFPYEVIDNAQKGGSKALDMLTGELPWYYRQTHRSETVIDHHPTAFCEGLTLVSGLTKDGNIEAKVITREGKVLHRWFIDWFDGFWPHPSHIPEEDLPKTRPATHIHGIALLENGDLLFNLDGFGLVRVDLCGNVVWRLPYRTHHSLDIDEAGNIWVAGQKRIRQRSPKLPNHRPPFEDHTVLEVSRSGEIVREISVFDVLIKNQLQGLLYMSTKNNWSTEVSGDTFHLNDVEIFPSHLQSGVFERGDVMISLRNINAILVFNPGTLHLKYFNIGRVVRQHDPDFVDGNRISIFDNNHVAPESQGPQSRIVIVDARNDQMQVIYSGSREHPFYTNVQGKHQWLRNGNMLITESTQGHAFEIDPEGELIWEYFNLVDEERLALLTEAQRLPPLFTPVFFELGRHTCGESQAP
jgi:arylsulfotransferase ASST